MLGYTAMVVKKICSDNYNYLLDISVIMDVEMIPPCPIINWDHTALKCTSRIMDGGYGGVQEGTNCWCA